MSKAPTAFRTISEVSEELDVPKHVLRFWEMKFPQIKPMKRGGGRRYYRPEDMALLKGIYHLLHAEAYTIKGVQKILRERGIDTVKEMGEEPTAKKSRGAKTPATAAKATTARKTAGKRAAGKAPRKVTAGKAAKTAPSKAARQRAASKAPAASPPAPQLDAAVIDALNRAISELQACRSALLGTPEATRSRPRSAGQARG